MTGFVVDGSAGAATHALVVGVGHYRYLEGGDDEDDSLWVRGGQLTSTPISAVAFTDWLLKDFRHPDAPLATVELLISSQPQLEHYHRPDTDADEELVPATFDNVKAAFSRWRKRLDENPDNVGMFYFSGHGFMRMNLGLLLEDLGAEASDPFEGSFDFDQTRTAMESCAARRQYYFVDACQSTLSRRNLLEDPWRVFWKPERKDFGQPVQGGLFEASSPSSQAYSRPGKISFFTQAVLDAFDGLGSDENDEGVWVVRPDRLSTAVILALDELRQSGIEAPKQFPRGSAGGREAVHLVGGLPRVPVTLWCNPKAAHAQAHLQILLENEEICSREPDAKPWDLKLHPRSYKLGARFDKDRYESGEHDFTVALPRYKRGIPITKRNR